MQSCCHSLSLMRCLYRSFALLPLEHLGMLNVWIPWSVLQASVSCCIIAFHRFVQMKLANELAWIGVKLVMVSRSVLRFIIWSAPEVSESCKWTLILDCQFAVVTCNQPQYVETFMPFCTNNEGREMLIMYSLPFPINLIFLVLLLFPCFM